MLIYFRVSSTKVCAAPLAARVLADGWAIGGRGVAFSIPPGTVKIGPGTLYGAFQVLEKDGLIVKVGEQERRKIYALTSNGREVLKKQVNRLVIMVRNGVSV